MDNAITIDTLALHRRDRHDDRALTAHCAALSAAARAPGDWPVATAHQPLWTYAPEFADAHHASHCDGSCRLRRSR